MGTSNRAVGSGHILFHVKLIYAIYCKQETLLGFDCTDSILFGCEGYIANATSKSVEFLSDKAIGENSGVS
jgi:hypothetical protein